MTRLIIMTRSAHVPAKARQFGRYVHHAVVETDLAAGEPAMISARAKGVVRILWDSGPVAEGKTERCASARALAEAEAVVARQAA